MSHKPDASRHDSTVEREIESLLDVEPSPEFVARVRTRIAREPAPSSWRWRWGFALAGAVALVVGAVIAASWTATFTPTEVPGQVVMTAPPPSVEPEASEAPQQHVKPDVRRVRVQAAQRRQPDRGRASDAPPFAEVLVSENEQRAFALLLTTIEQRRLPPMPAPVDAAESIEPAALDIPKLVIEPLPQIAALE